MKFLFHPSISWAVFLAWALVFGAFSWDGADFVFLALAAMVFIILMVVDYVVRTHLHLKAVADQDRADQAKALELEQAEKNPNILARLEGLSEQVVQLYTENGMLRLDLELAQAEREKAEAEREDIRNVLNYNRAQYRAEQLESQDLREQLDALRTAQVKGGAL